MKWVRFERGGRSQFGTIEDGWVQEIPVGWDELLAGEKVPPVGPRISLTEVKLICPIPRPGKIIAIGLNYMDHCREQNLDPPEIPIIFTKFSTSVVGPGQPICWSPQVTQQVDYEAELAVVIGSETRGVSRAKAFEHILGYTAANDVSARDLQFRDGQWVRGKSLDTFCPLGPWLVTTAEVPDPQTLDIRCTVNGQVLQQSNTSEMIFEVADLVSFCSQHFTLDPGDVILSGTPDGVGVFRDPQIFLQDGDRVAVEIESIGRLENYCLSKLNGPVS